MFSFRKFKMHFGTPKSEKFVSSLSQINIVNVASVTDFCETALLPLTPSDSVCARGNYDFKNSLKPPAV